MKTFASRFWLILVIAGLLAASCAPGLRLKSRPAGEVVTQSTYTLILHGCNYGNDPATIAFLRREDQPYLFQLRSPEFQYRVREGLAADDALNQARGFVNCSPHFSHSTLRAIIGPDGTEVGYEVRPYYNPLFFRWNVLLDTSYYFIDGQKVLVYVRSEPIVDELDDMGDE